MRLATLTAAALLALSGAATAQDVKFDIQPTLDCIDKAQRSDHRPICVGEAAQACIRRSPGAGPVDISLCMEQETRYWSRRMDTALEAMEEKASAADAAFAETEMAEHVPFKLTEDLALMQDAWKDWREKRCAFEAMLRRGTPDASISAAWCMVRQTGAQALFIEQAARQD
ncbi:MAG: lysozyme inhibitor LprI family protein [Paracoccaceae bacterium]